jgi:RimJ/RimL family protein N-acetyltransferase
MSAKTPPHLETERLLLRMFTLADAPRVKELAGHALVAATTLNVPHPYEEHDAEKWIANHEPDFLLGRSVQLAITLRDCGEIIGAISLGVDQTNHRAEMGYWMGVDYWGRGYCTEAARALVEYGFETLALHKITSRHFESNPASGRVMQKIGMQQEGFLRDDFWKNGQWHNVPVYGMINPADGE